MSNLLWPLLVALLTFGYSVVVVALGCVYSTLVHNYWVFFANIAGLVLSVHYNLQAIKLQFHGHHSGQFRASLIKALESSVNDESEPTSSAAVLDYAQIIWNVASLNVPAPKSHEKYVMAVVLLWAIVISVAGFATGIPDDLLVILVGYIVIFQLIFLFAAPLSTVFKVFQTRSSETIHLPTVLTQTVKASFMFAYGLGIGDLFIAMPNLVGIVLCVVLLTLAQIFPRKSKQGDNEEADLESGKELEATEHSDETSISESREFVEGEPSAAHVEIFL